MDPENPTSTHAAPQAPPPATADRSPGSSDPSALAMDPAARARARASDPSALSIEALEALLAERRRTAAAEQRRSLGDCLRAEAAERATKAVRLAAADALRLRARAERWSDDRLALALAALVPCTACGGHGYVDAGTLDVETRARLEAAGERRRTAAALEAERLDVAEQRSAALDRALALKRQGIYVETRHQPDGRITLARRDHGVWSEVT